MPSVSYGLNLSYRDPQGRHCAVCHRIFAAGTVPWTPPPHVCRDCREKMREETPPPPSEPLF